MKHSLKIIEIPCDQIRIGERHRKDMGDLEVLAASIATVGLLHPPVVTEDGLLVCGERRFLAMRDILRWKTIPVIVLRVSSIVAGEYAENEVRKDFTPSERVAIGKAVEAEIGKRQGQRTDLEPVEDLPQVPPGTKTREFAAERAGFGNARTYQQAKKVTETGAPELVAAMDAGDVSIDAAAIIAQEPPEAQREIVQMPAAVRRQIVRQLREGLRTALYCGSAAHRARDGHAGGRPHRQVPLGPLGRAASGAQRRSGCDLGGDARCPGLGRHAARSRCTRIPARILALPGHPGEIASRSRLAPPL